MSDCKECSEASSIAKQAFNRVIDATLNEKRNRNDDGEIDWDLFRGAVEGSLDYTFSPKGKKKR